MLSLFGQKALLAWESGSLGPFMAPLNSLSLISLVVLLSELKNNTHIFHHLSTPPILQTSTKMSSPMTKQSIVILAVTISSSLIILFAILYILYCLWYYLVHRSPTIPFDAPSPLSKLQRFSYKELKNATRSFGASNFIGKGASGAVFKGVLKNGKLIVVKRIHPSSFQCEQEFQNEVRILGGLKKHCPLVVSLLGFCVDKGKRLLVYDDYMPNRSLQECLFRESNVGSCNNLTLSWPKRFAIILDVAKALAFLHVECEPPVIHGDVKPSNVLLDSEFRAKISDFGLSRLKLESETGVAMFSQDLGKSQQLLKSQGNDETPDVSHENDDVDFALALQASSSSKSHSYRIYHNVMGLAMNPLKLNYTSDGEKGNNGGGSKGKELSADKIGAKEWNKFVLYDDEFSFSSADHSKELNLNNSMAGEDGNSNNNNAGTKQWGKDWWWRQGGSDEFCSKDYVKEWIGSQIKSPTNPDWDEEKGMIHENTNLDNSEIAANPMQEQGLDVVLKPSFEKQDSRMCKVDSEKHRKMQEWWKVEHLAETHNKGSKKAIRRLQARTKSRFIVPNFSLGKCFEITRRQPFRQHFHNKDDEDFEFSFRRRCREKHSSSLSGDLFSHELSSRTSVRGTLCYVAPECSGHIYLMEKVDIYSLGVLILVIVSGRRPLHVLSSPMKLEKANLISWSRSLSNSGNILELVDERLRNDYNKEEASLCINLALTCLQKMPELRPDVGDVVKILEGEMDLPPPQFDMSPSPPWRSNSRRSRRKQK